MRSTEEIKQIFDVARANGVDQVIVDGVTYHLSPDTKPPGDNPTEQQLRDVFSAGDYTDQEILYYATPYFDELQTQKQLKQEALNGKKEDDNSAVKYDTISKRQGDPRG